MPKVNLSNVKKQQAPPIDWLWAAILERKMVYGYDLHKMAEIAGVHYSTMRKYIRVSPWRWEAKARNNICEAFGIIPTQSVKLVTAYKGVSQ